MRLLDFLRPGPGRENIRRLALDVAAHAGELIGRRVPADWEGLSTHELLRIARTSLTAAEDRIRDADLRIAALREEASLARQRDPGSDLAPPDDPPPIVNDLIEVADRLAVLDSAPDEAGTVPARWLEGRVAAMLARHEVSVIRDEGPVDPSRHEVVDVRPAPADGDVERIAETVRPGYSWRGRILRPQQVVAFVKRIR